MSHSLRVVILEPAFVKLLGHYADVSMRVGREFQTRGHSVTVYASERATPDVVKRFAQAGIEVKPYFRVPTKWIRNFFGKKFAAWALSHIRGKDFLNLPEADLYLWPTLEKNQLLPLRYLPEHRNMVGGLWFTIDVPGSREFLKHRAAVLNRFAIGVYDEHLRTHLAEKISDGRFCYLPVPFDGMPQPMSGSSAITVGLFGHIQPSRGGNLMPQLTKAILDSGWQYNLNGVLHGADVPVDRNSARGYIEDLSPLIASCHFILWPSDGNHYKFQTSGNTFQAIANGTPIIVPSGCLPARLLDEYDLDYPRFDEQSVESVMKAARELMSDYAQYKAKALLAAERWRIANGTKKFVDHLVALC